MTVYESIRRAAEDYQLPVIKINLDKLDARTIQQTEDMLRNAGYRESGIPKNGIQVYSRETVE